MATASEAVLCPGCGRKVSAKLATCIYCRANLRDRDRGAAAASDAESAAPTTVECALCHQAYSPRAHPGGCPRCQKTIGAWGAEAAETRASWSEGWKAALALIALLAGNAAGGAALQWADRRWALFDPGVGLHLCLILLGIVVSAAAAFLVFRLRVRSIERPARGTRIRLWAFSGLLFLAGVSCMRIWSAFGVTVLNGAGLASPFPVRTCAVQPGSDLDGGDVLLTCDTESGPVRGWARADNMVHSAAGAPPGLGLREGRLGLWVVDSTPSRRASAGGLAPGCVRLPRRMSDCFQPCPHGYVPDVPGCRCCPPEGVDD